MSQKVMLKKIFSFITIFIVSAVLFFVFTVPFHNLLSVFTVSEVRFSAVLYPVLGINFGLPSALGITTANFVSDAINGYPLGILLEGIPAQFCYAMAPRLIWRFFVRNDENKYRLDSVKRVLQFAFVCAVSAILAAAFVGYLCVKYYGLNFMQVAIFVLLNNFEVSMVLGCPLMIILNQIIARKNGVSLSLSTNENIIIFSTLVEMIALFLLVFIMYTSNKTLGTYDIWNSVYFCILIIIAFLFIVSLLLMIIFEKIIKNE